MMGTHRRAAFVDFLLGSVTSAVLKRSTVPVFFHH
jgi:nucleotide-binding universal stress UspA family protein